MKGISILIYQKIFTDEKPYHIGVGCLAEFPEHRHADFEMNFCVDGEFDIIIDRKIHHVQKGCTTFIPSMCSHAIPNQTHERRVLTLIVGPALLKKHFSAISRLISEPQVFDLNGDEKKELRELFYECALAMSRNEDRDELLVIGNIYKIFSHIRKSLSSKDVSEACEKDYSKIENVEKALDLIHYNYKEDVTLEQAALLTGYSKSNFCKIFKKTVGESFHQALNRQRINNAVGFLTMSNMSVSEISEEVGFHETKSFCRVFKNIYGMTPGEYKKRIGK